ncbi:DNA helicase [Tanacetum coccineum]|uniref:DNA helicase n=1 Tax=Tanacetum coccineum TaxID=301880 RepID=A0ABQ5CQW7_9ASTR
MNIGNSSPTDIADVAVCVFEQKVQDLCRFLKKAALFGTVSGSASEDHLPKNLQSGATVPDFSPIMPRLRPRVSRRLSFFRDTNDSTRVVVGPSSSSNQARRKHFSVSQTTSSESSLHGVPSSYLDLGDCDQACEYFHAEFWLPFPRDPPEIIKELFKDRHFMESIRACNMMFAMTSFGANVDDSDNNGSGPYLFKTLLFWYLEQPKTCVDKELPEFKIRLYNNGNRMRYNAPVLGSLGAIVYDSGPRCQYDFDIIIHMKDEHGWSPELKLVNNGSRDDKQLTMNMFYSFQLHDRFNLYALLPRGCRLFQQYLVNAYISIKKNRLDYIQSKQDMFRSEYLQGVHGALLKGDSDGHDAGKRIILTASFTGSPRYMYKHYQDALAICRVHGNPQYFITFTCNVKWPEIKRYLQKYSDMKSEDRPDIISRVFEIKTYTRVNFKKGSAALPHYFVGETST